MTERSWLDKKYNKVEALINSQDPRWLAGLFEVGGSLGFAISRSSTKGDHSYPLVRIGETDNDKAQALVRLLGGYVKPTNYFSYKNQQWVLQGPPAVALAERMKPFAPWREEQIDAFLNWENIPDTQDRIEFVEDYRKQDEPNMINSVVYDDLVKNPFFLAGVIDNRGSLIFSEKKTSPRLQVRSTNSGLVMSLYAKYGGWVEHDGDKARWVLGVDESSKLLYQLNNFLRLKTSPRQ